MSEPWTRLELITPIWGGALSIGLVGGLIGFWLGKLLAGLIVVFFVLLATFFLALGMLEKYWPQYASPAAMCLLGYFFANRLARPRLFGSNT